MDADLFLQQFGHLAQSDDGIDKLRALIYVLASKGKLVEPEGSVRSVVLPKISEFIMGQAPAGASYNDRGEGTIFVKVGEFGPRYPRQEVWTTAPQKFAKMGDVLICVVGATIGKLNLAIDCAIGRSVAAIRPNKEIDTVYLYYSLMPYSLKLRAGAQGSAQGVISRKHLSEMIIRLPSLAEQRRIVAKVDELMELCGRLEISRKAQRGLKTQAVQATLQHLMSVPSFASVGTSLNILERGFGHWFDDLATVKYLRAAILQLAVQGKLVPQDSSDEPSEKLVSRVNKKKCPFKPAQPPFLLPHGWTWASFPQLGEFGRGKSKHRPRNDPRLYVGGKHPFVQTGDVSRAKDYIRTYSATYNDEGLAQSKMWPTGTMCITIAANIAETAILAFDACFPDSVVGFIPDKEIGDARYFEYFLRTAKTRLEDFAPATAQKNINLGILEQVAIPLPPNAELKRIVAKVGEMMTLCDQLEARIIHAKTLNTHLMDSLIYRIADAA